MIVILLITIINNCYSKNKKQSSKYNFIPVLPGRSTIWCLIKSSQSFRFILCFWLSPPGQTEPASVEGGLVWSQLVYVYLEKLLWSEDGRETCFTDSRRSSSIQCIITILLSATSLTALVQSSYLSPLTFLTSVICTSFRVASACSYTG